MYWLISQALMKLDPNLLMPPHTSSLTFPAMAVLMHPSHPQWGRVRGSRILRMSLPDPREKHFQLHIQGANSTAGLTGAVVSLCGHFPSHFSGWLTLFIVFLTVAWFEARACCKQGVGGVGLCCPWPLGGWYCWHSLDTLTSSLTGCIK